MFKALRNMIVIGSVVIFIAAFGRMRYVQSVTDPANSAVQDSSTVDRGDILLTVSASGPIHAAQELPLVFLSTGNVMSVNVQEGQHVLKGQTLAMLDTRAQQNALADATLALKGEQVALNALTASPRTADLTAAQTALAAAKAGLAAANVGYDPTRVQLAQVQVDLAKNAAWQSQLRRDQAKASGSGLASVAQLNGVIGGLPEPQRDQVKQAVDALLGSASSLVPSAQEAEIQVHSTSFDVQVAQAQLGQAKDAHADPGSIGAAQAAVVQAQTGLDQLVSGADARSIAIAQAQLDAAQAAVALTQYNLAHGTLIAPFAGVVTQVNLTPGQAAPLDKPALTLIDDSSFYVDIAVDELDVSKVAPGQPVTFAFDALPGVPISGSVARVANTALSVGGVVTYEVRISINGANQPLRAGMSATATITVSQLHDAIRVRNRFVRLDRKTGAASVIVQAADGSFKDRPVTLGLRNETFSEVRSGLQPGDTVVVLPRDTNLLGL